MLSGCTVAAQQVHSMNRYNKEQEKIKTIARQVACLRSWRSWMLLATALPMRVTVLQRSGLLAACWAGQLWEEGANGCLSALSYLGLSIQSKSIFKTTLAISENKQTNKNRFLSIVLLLSLQFSTSLLKLGGEVTLLFFEWSKPNKYRNLWLTWKSWW